jgi:hypothetical protein
VDKVRRQEHKDETLKGFRRLWLYNLTPRGHDRAKFDLRLDEAATAHAALMPALWLIKRSRGVSPNIPS